MKGLRKFFIFVMMISILLPSSVVQAKSTDTTANEMAKFYKSVMTNDGYITCTIDILHHKNNTYTVDMVFQENILGIDIGFYSSPYILKFMDSIEMEYSSAFEGDYLVTIGSKHYKTLEEVGNQLSVLPFFEMTSDSKGLFAEMDLTIWDSERKKDEFVDDIYGTNYFVFSYQTSDEVETNANQYVNGTSIWKGRDGEVGGYYVLFHKSPVGTIVSVLFFIIFILFIIMVIIRFVSFRLNRRKSKHSSSDYGYEDDYY